MNKQNWASRIVVVILISIFLIGAILIGRNRYILNQKIKMATAQTQAKESSFEIWTIEGEIQKVIEEVIPIYKKEYPDIKFKVKVFKSDIYNEILINACRTNSLPDMFYSWGGQRLADFVEMDAVADITESVGVMLADKLHDKVLEEYTYNDRIYGLPIFGWNNILYCNTELFKQCGLELPTTYDELLEVVQAFKAQGVTPMIMGGGEAWTASLYFMELVLDSGDLECVDELRENSSVFRSKAFQEAAKKFKQLIDLQPWQTGFETSNSTAAAREFLRGNGAMILLGSWASVDMDNIVLSLVKGKVKAIHFPRNNINQAGIGGYGDGFVLNKKTSYEDVAAQKLFIDMVKEISDHSVVHKGLGIPVYTDQCLEGTKHELLKQCSEIWGAEYYHQAYDQILDYRFVKDYNTALQDFIRGHVSRKRFIQQAIDGREEYDG